MDCASIAENLGTRSKTVEAQRTKEQARVKEETKERHPKILDESSFKETNEEESKELRSEPSRTKTKQNR